VKRGFKAWPLVLLVVITALCYVNSLRSDFVFDDMVIVYSPGMLGIHNLHDVGAYVGGPRTILFLTYALNHYFGGLNTFGYHLVNVLLHLLNVLLVYGILLTALRQVESKSATPAAFAGALIFGVHPLFSSAVSYVAGRSSVLCATFYFSSVLMFLKGLDAKRRSARVIYFLCTGLFFWFAWMTKQEAITLPLLLAGIVFLRSEKRDWRWIALLAATPLVAAFLIRKQLSAMFASIAANEQLVNAGFGTILSGSAFVETYFTSVVTYYLPRLMVPIRLSIDPDIVPVEHWYSSEFLLSLLLLGVLVGLMLHFRKSQRLISLGIAALMISPLLAYGIMPLPDVVLEHRTYIPGLGIALLAAWLFDRLQRNYANVAVPAFGVVAALFVVMTIQHNRVWANNITLWEDAAVKAPTKARTHFNLAQSYQNVGRYPDALHEYNRALELKPDLFAAYSNMSGILLNQGDMGKAQEVLQKVVALAPNFAEGFINLGVFYVRLRQPDKALEVLDRAVKLAPESYPAHFNRGEALTLKGDFKAALEGYKEAARLRPDIPQIRMGLAVGYWRTGDLHASEQELLELTKGPLAADAYRNLGVLENQRGGFERAIGYLRQAINLRNPFPDAQHDLGIAYLQTHMYDAAIEQFQTTLAQQPNHGAAPLNLATAYEKKGNRAVARQILEKYLQQYGSTNSPYVPQARERLNALKN
jgi:protein O-mannosyl-transferase